MPIHPLLENASRGPAEIKVMQVAHEACLRVLRLSDNFDALSELIASHIVAISNTGERNPVIIASQAMKLAGIRSAE
jgi:hypothetical protein